MSLILKKKTTNAGKYIADIISVNLVNSDTCFKVFDRDNLGSINEAKKLIAEGYIDAANAKELSKILSVEAIIIGNYTVLSNSIKLTLKALDSESGFIVAASMKDLPLNQDAGALLGINVNTDSGSSANRGFNAPVPSNENINNPNTVSQECETQKTGDYCFTNNTQKRLKVICTPMFSTQNGYRSSYVSGSDLTLELGQTQCFYNLDAGSYEYSVEEITNSVNRGYQYGQQNFSQNGANIS